MTLTIPTTHAAVSDNPRLPVLAECPREGVYAIVIFRQWTVVRPGLGHRSPLYLFRGQARDWRLVRDPLAPVEVCEWCQTHVCRVCLGKHRRCRQRRRP